MDYQRRSEMVLLTIPMKPTKLLLVLAALAACLGLTACKGRVQHGGIPRVDPAQVKIFMPAFSNATDDEHAGRALTEITASVLLQEGLPLIQKEPALVRSRGEKAAGPDGVFTETAKMVGATHVLIGTVHEYRYKTDLDGDPVVGVSMRLIDAQTGETLWQGSSSKVKVFFASLTGTAQAAVQHLVDHMPLPTRHHKPAADTRPAAPVPPTKGKAAKPGKEKGAYNHL